VSLSAEAGRVAWKLQPSRRGHMGRGPGERALAVWLLARDDCLPTPSRNEFPPLARVWHRYSHLTRAAGHV
jgi:hypothetical protein